MYKPGDLVTEVVVWEVVEFDKAKNQYKCREKKGRRTRYFDQNEFGVQPVEQKVEDRS